MTLYWEDLRARFERALVAAGAQRAGPAVFDELLRRYCEPHRHYHTIEHIDACLVWLDWYRGVAERPELVELALWFHDAVYDNAANDNEARSAALARERLAALGVHASAIASVTECVEATQRHSATRGDCALLVDLDLTILGAAPSVYARFETQIRAEYAHVPERAFAPGRTHVLRGFLARPRIFQTTGLQEQLEWPARGNLKLRIEQLAGEG